MFSKLLDLFGLNAMKRIAILSLSLSSTKISGSSRRRSSQERGLSEWWRVAKQRKARTHDMYEMRKVCTLACHTASKLLITIIQSMVHTYTYNNTHLLPKTNIIIQHTHTLLYIYSIIKIKIYLITIIELNYKLCLLYFASKKGNGI